MPALDLFPATKVGSTNDKSAVVSTWRLVRPVVVNIGACLVMILFVFQTLVQVREPPLCKICETVMKQLETMLEDKATEVKMLHLL